MKRAGMIIAESLGIDSANIGEYRYQDTKTSQPIYSIGDEYFAVGTKAPTFEAKWQQHSDQFFAKKSGTVLWVAKAEEEEAT